MTKSHKNATTTPEVRAFIRESELATAVLARLLKVSEATVRKWRNRIDNSDASHIPKQLNTTLTAKQQYVVVLLRVRLKLSLDELLFVSKEFINENTSRAGLQRCLKRHRVSRLSELDEFVETDEDTSYVQFAIEESFSSEVVNAVVNPQSMSDFLTQMRKEMADVGEKVISLDNKDVVQVYMLTLPEIDKGQQQGALLLAHDLQSKWVYVDLYHDDAYKATQRYITYVFKKAPFHIRRVLAKNYNEFLSRFRLLDKRI